MKKTLFYSFLFLLSLKSFAQRTATKTQTFDTPIENIILNQETGVIYVKEDTQTFCLF